MNRRIVLLLFLCLAAPGCISFHDKYECELSAQKTRSREPATGYPVRVIYPYDHYGVFYFLNAPKAVEAQLDKDGHIRMTIADFNFPHLVVGSTIFQLDQAVIKGGGRPYKFPYNGTDEQYQNYRKAYTVYDLPAEKYPEVDVLITPCESLKREN